MKERTGKTARMLQQALDEGMAGGRVYVVASDSSHAYQLWAMAKKMGYVSGIGYNHDDHGKSIGFSNGEKEIGRVFFVPPKPKFDWENMCFSGDGRVPGITHVDHHAIEQRFSKMLTELHKYDLPTPPPIPPERCVVCGDLKPCGCKRK